MKNYIGIGCSAPKTTEEKCRDILDEMGIFLRRQFAPVFYRYLEPKDFLKEVVVKLPKHKCGLFLSHNEHRDYYQSIEEAILEREEHRDWRSEEDKAEAIATDELWELQWYPDTPISSYCVAAPTLEKLLEYAMEVEAEIN